jgi:hypothetical protein
MDPMNAIGRAQSMRPYLWHSDDFGASFEELAIQNSPEAMRLGFPS